MNQTLIAIFLIDDSGSQPKVLVIRDMVDVLANQLSVKYPIFTIRDKVLDVCQDMVQSIELFSLPADELFLKVGTTNAIELLTQTEPLVLIHFQLADLISLLHFPLRNELEPKCVVYSLDITPNANGLGDNAHVERPQFVLRTF